MLPAEFRAAQASLPVCFLPLGTVEWHGEHNALGLDALKAHALCVKLHNKRGVALSIPRFMVVWGIEYARHRCG